MLIILSLPLRCYLIFWGAFVLFFRLVEPYEIKVSPEFVIDLVLYLEAMGTIRLQETKATRRG